jgi:hypothetical protein
MKDQAIPEAEPVETVEFDCIHEMLDVDHDHVHCGQNLDFLLRDLCRQPELPRGHDEVFLQDLCAPLPHRPVIRSLAAHCGPRICRSVATR